MFYFRNILKTTSNNIIPFDWTTQGNPSHFRICETIIKNRMHENHSTECTSWWASHHESIWDCYSHKSPRENKDNQCHFISCKQTIHIFLTGYMEGFPLSTWLVYNPDVPSPARHCRISFILLQTKASRKRNVLIPPETNPSCLPIDLTVYQRCYGRAEGRDGRQRWHHRFPLKVMRYTGTYTQDPVKYKDS